MIEHIVSRPKGNNGYRNVVAACRECNNRKKNMPAADYIRKLYREGVLSLEDFKTRLSLLEAVLEGRLRPEQSRGLL